MGPSSLLLLLPGEATGAAFSDGGGGGDCDSGGGSGSDGKGLFGSGSDPPQKPTWASPYLLPGTGPGRDGGA